ncbi:SpoIIE family protein phosphatase [Amycolatopsis sp. NPDC004368]
MRESREEAARRFSSSGMTWSATAETRGSSVCCASSRATTTDVLDAAAGRLRGAHAATVYLVIFDPDAGAVEYCTAGHPPPPVRSPSGRRGTCRPPAPDRGSRRRVHRR